MFLTLVGAMQKYILVKTYPNYALKMSSFHCMQMCFIKVDLSKEYRDHDFDLYKDRFRAKKH